MTAGADTIYLYDGWRCIEERECDENEAGTEDDAWEPRRQYVYGGIYIDHAAARLRQASEPLIFDKDSVGGDGICDNARYFYCQQANYNVVALADSTGASVQTVLYDPYGQATLSGNTGNPYLFQSQRWDTDAGMYYFRNRWYHPVLGRFMQRDRNTNAQICSYEFAASRPLTFVDPGGDTWVAIMIRPKAYEDIDKDEVSKDRDRVSKFVNCDDNSVGRKLSPAEKETIREQVTKACGTLRDALAYVESENFPEGLDPTRKADYGSKKAELASLLHKALKSSCDVGVDIECECECKAGTTSYTRGHIWGSWSNTHLCPEYFQSDYSAQLEAIIHEITHYGGSGDAGDGTWNEADVLKVVLPQMQKLRPPKRERPATDLYRMM
ncbi:MAG TPA: RHS repeat-associated core domain-containing protein [Planctomycetota bacterium]|nr:RHS repeat-associated core domain-containing protein [Planctomycetota bacterium]